MTSFPVILDPELCRRFFAPSPSTLPPSPLAGETGGKYEAEKGIREWIVRFDRWNGKEEGGRNEARRGEARIGVWRNAVENRGHSTPAVGT